jgi:hypothetical protein
MLWSKLQKDLLVDAVRPSGVIAQRKQPDVIDNGFATRPIRARIARAAHHVSSLVAGPQSPEQLPQFLAFSRLDHVVSIQPECEIAGGM